jgi:perosamine synthetase
MSELNIELARILEAGKKSGGGLRAEEQTKFEAALARTFGVREAVVVSSGTAALHCALAALEIGPRDEVLVPALAVPMSVAPVLYQGAIPVIIDCQHDRIDFDYEDLKRNMTSRTRAVMPVYMWGCAYNADRLKEFAREHNLAIIEDACQAHGSKWGSKFLGAVSNIGCFSLKDGKLISTGEGGFLLLDDPALATVCRALRGHWLGARPTPPSGTRIGWNYRLTEVQAFVGQRELLRLEEALAVRERQARYLIDALRGLDQVQPYCYYEEERSNHFAAVFILAVTDGREVCESLARLGVENSVGTYGFCPVQERVGIGDLIRLSGSPRVFETPNAKKFTARVLAISLTPDQDDRRLQSIVASIASVFRTPNESPESG